MISAITVDGYDPDATLGRGRPSGWPPCRCGSERCPDRELGEVEA